MCHLTFNYFGRNAITIHFDDAIIFMMIHIADGRNIKKREIENEGSKSAELVNHIRFPVCPYHYRLQ